MPERSNGAVSKTVDHSFGPRVRIPVFPLHIGTGCLRFPDVAACWRRQWRHKICLAEAVGRIKESHTFALKE